MLTRLLGELRTTIGVAAILAAGVTASAADEWRFGVITPAKQIWTQEAEAFGADVSEKLDGKHTVSVFHSGQLGNEGEMIRQLQSGALTFALITVSEVASRVPQFNALLAPGLVDSNENTAAVLRNSSVAADLMDNLSQIGVRGLGYGMAGNTQVITNVDAASLEDLAGSKVRITPSPAIRDLHRINGSNAIPLPLPAVYDAFANSQVDGVEINLDLMRILKLDAIGSTLLITNQSMFPSVLLVSERAWRQMSDEEKAAITEAAGPFLEKVIDRTVEGEVNGLAGFRDAGKLNIVELSPEDMSELAAAWDAEWADRLPMLPELRAQAAELSPKSE